MLPVPAATGLVALRVNGNVIDRPERSARGLFLGERERDPRDRLLIQRLPARRHQPVFVEVVWPFVVQQRVMVA